MDRYGRSVDGSAALDNLTGVIDAYQIALLDEAEVHAEGVDPVGVRELRVARRDVAGDALVQARAC